LGKHEGYIKEKRFRAKGEVIWVREHVKKERKSLKKQSDALGGRPGHVKIKPEGMGGGRGGEGAAKLDKAKIVKEGRPIK